MLALHEGPPWERLCYTPAAARAIAAVITLLLVPVHCAIFVEAPGLARCTGRQNRNDRKPGCRDHR